MTISWGKPLKTKYLSFIFGNGWEKGTYKFFEIRKVPLGWSVNLWRFLITYDNWGRINKKNVQRECSKCKKHYTMYCPNSSLCYSLEEKPYFEQ